MQVDPSPFRRRRAARFLCATAFVGTVVIAPAARADFVDRPITFRDREAALDLGLGIGHINPPMGPDTTGVGFNFEFIYGLTSRLELGLRTGPRIGTDGRATDADRFARPFNKQTYPETEGTATFANPEVRLRGALVRGGPVEVALEGRVWLPFSGDFAFALALPLALHVGGMVRIDTGLYIPIVFADDDTHAIIDLPFDLWVQATRRLWLGPMTGARHRDGAGWAVPLGLGLGYDLGGGVDLKTWILFEDVDHGHASNLWGAGVALHFRF